MPEGILLAAEHHLAVDQRGALADRHHRVVARVGPLVGHQEPRELVDVEGHLADDRPVHARQVRRDQRRLAAVATEHLDHRQPLVGAGARAELMHEVHGPRDRRREPDAVVGAVDVVVHRLGDRDDRHAFVVQPQRERQRVVAADRDQRADPQSLDHPQHVVGVVARPVLGPARRQERRLVGGAHLRRVRPRCVQERAAGAVDRAHGRRVEDLGADMDRQRVLRVDPNRPPQPRRMPTT